VENRLADQRARRPGAALIALAAIIVITAAWWALALWPVGTVEPEWLARTRAACFGSARGGLPDAGGWVLLIGEPLGMLVALVMGFGGALRQDLQRLMARRAGRASMAGAALLSILVIAILAAHVGRAWAERRPIGRGAGNALTRIDERAPHARLVDQNGRSTSLDDVRGRPMLLAFAYGHCTTVCPTIVSDLRAARLKSGRDVGLVILTLDPWRDTPERLQSLAQHWNIGPGDRVLSGEASAVARTLDELGIGRRRSETNGDIDHGTTVLLIDASGRVTWRLDGGAAALPALLGKL